MGEIDENSFGVGTDDFVRRRIGLLIDGSSNLERAMGSGGHVRVSEVVGEDNVVIFITGEALESNVLAKIELLGLSAAYLKKRVDSRCLSDHNSIVIGYAVALADEFLLPFLVHMEL